MVKDGQNIVVTPHVEASLVKEKRVMIGAKYKVRFTHIREDKKYNITILDDKGNELTLYPKEYKAESAISRNLPEWF